MLGTKGVRNEIFDTLYIVFLKGILCVVFILANVYTVLLCFLKKCQDATKEALPPSRFWFEVGTRCVRGPGQSWTSTHIYYKLRLQPSAGTISKTI